MRSIACSIIATLSRKLTKTIHLRVPNSQIQSIWERSLQLVNYLGNRLKQRFQLLLSRQKILDDLESWNVTNTHLGAWQFCDCDLFGIVKWSELKGCWWPPTGGSKGHVGHHLEVISAVFEKLPSIRIGLDRPKVVDKMWDKSSQSDFLLGLWFAPHSDDP